MKTEHVNWKILSSFSHLRFQCKVSSVAQLHGNIKRSIKTLKIKIQCSKRYYAYLPGFKPCVYWDLNVTKEKKGKFGGVYNRKATATIIILCQCSYLPGRVRQQLKFYNKNRIVRAVCQCQPGWEVSHLLLSERPAVLPCSWILPAEITGSSADCNTKITGDSLSCFLGASNDIP